MGNDSAMYDQLSRYALALCNPRGSSYTWQVFMRFTSARFAFARAAQCRGIGIALPSLFSLPPARIFPERSSAFPHPRVHLTAARRRSPLAAPPFVPGSLWSALIDGWASNRRSPQCQSCVAGTRGSPLACRMHAAFMRYERVRFIAPYLSVSARMHACVRPPAPPGWGDA